MNVTVCESTIICYALIAGELKDRIGVKINKDKSEFNIIWQSETMSHEDNVSVLVISYFVIVVVISLSASFTFSFSNNIYILFFLLL